MPGELDHATGLAEATIENPKGPTSPRSDPVKAECQFCGSWKELQSAETLLCCGSRPLGIFI